LTKLGVTTTASAEPGNYEDVTFPARDGVRSRAGSSPRQGRAS